MNGWVRIPRGRAAAGSTRSWSRYLGLIGLSFLLGGAFLVAPRTTVSNVGARQTVGGITYVSKSFVLKRGEWKTFRAPCPTGTHVLGGGHYNDGGFLDVIGSHSYPFDGEDRGRTPDDGWAAMLGGFNETHSVTMYAQCAHLLPTYVEETDQAEGRSKVGATASCAAGQEVISGGTRGHRGLQEELSIPVLGPPEGWFGRAFNDDNETRTLHVIAVCADLAVSVNNTDGTALHRAQNFIETSCPADQLVVGGGHIVGLGSTATRTGVIAASRPVGTDGWALWVDNYEPNEDFFLRVLTMCIPPLPS